jgi:hypothetical protein
LDNGWNSELSVANVEQTMKRLEIDLFTYVLDWEEFKDLQVAFLKSSIANAEFPTDHAINAILLRMASSRGIPYLIMGTNIVTESVMPKSWLNNPLDARLINGIHRQFGKVKLKTFPQLSAWNFFFYLILKGIKWIPLLNYVPYDKQQAKRLLIEELGWRDYGGKHYESIYTRFFHAYYLPAKFGYDTRRPYLSALILSGQQSREAALEEMRKPPAPPDQIEEDIEFVTKKLGLSHEEFNQIMTASPKSYTEYPNSDGLWNRFASLVNFARQKAIRIG